MRVNVTREILLDIKACLRQHLPTVRSGGMSHALARGLGYRANAALAVELRTGAVLRSVDSAAFAARIKELSGAEAPEKLLTAAVLRAAERSLVPETDMEAVELSMNRYYLARLPQSSVEEYKRLTMEITVTPGANPEIFGRYMELLGSLPGEMADMIIAAEEPGTGETDGPHAPMN